MAYRWKPEEVNAVIHVWGEFEGELRKQCHNKGIYEKMLSQLHAILGNDGISLKQLKKKIDNLKTLFKEEKKKHLKTGCSPSQWAYFEKVKFGNANY